MAQRPIANGRFSGPGRDDDKKVFVGGLGRSITEKELWEYFIQFGEIENINIKTHPFSGLSRGFAFVQFVNAKSVDDLLVAGDHFIANKKVYPKRVNKNVNPFLCKIFVGGLTTAMTEQDIRNHFVQFGQISDYQQPFDKIKNQKKGYCYITFEDSEVVKQLLKNTKQVINGKEVNVQKVWFNSERVNAVNTRTGPMSGARDPSTFGVRSEYPTSIALTAAFPYGTAADYGYAANPYNALTNVYMGLH